MKNLSLGCRTAVFVALTIFAGLSNPCETRAACPDILVRQFTFTGSHVISPGQVIGYRLKVVVGNVGEVSSGPFTVGLYISMDSIISLDDALLIGGREFVANVDPGTLVRVDLFGGMSIPGDWPFGSAYLGAVLDEDNNSSECDETNNTAAISVLVPPDVYLCGDADVNGVVDPSDVAFLRDYYFGLWDGWSIPLEAADMDCNGQLRLNDVVLLADLVFGRDPHPCCATLTKILPHGSEDSDPAKR